MPAEKLYEYLEDIAKEISDLAGEVKVLREVLDEIRDDFAWALNNDKFKGTRKRPRLHVPDDEPA